MSPHLLKKKMTGKSRSLTPVATISGEGRDRVPLEDNRETRDDIFFFLRFDGTAEAVP
jgi:hypothetical protein